MYRLLNFKSSQSVRLLINRRKCIENPHQSFHSLFNQKNHLLKVSDHFQSTPTRSIINADILKLIAKKRKKQKKVIELLQVTSKSTKQTTTPVHNLKADKLSKFIEAASIKLKNTRKLSHDVKSSNNISIKTSSSVIDNKDLPIIFVDDNVNDLSLSKNDLCEIINSYHERQVENIDETAEATNAVEEELEEEHHEIIPEIEEKVPKLKDRFQGSKASRMAEAEKLTKQRSLSLSLRAYIDCCVQNGMVNRGYLTLIRFRWRFQKNPDNGTKINDVDVYNLLMRGYAEKENYVKLLEIKTILEEDLEPNYQTYATLFDCLGRISKDHSSMLRNKIKSEEELDEVIRQVIVEAENLNISLNTILDRSIFVKDQREMVMDAIRRIKPDFQPIYTPPTLLYDNNLVNQLNENVQPIEYDAIENIHIKNPGSEIMTGKQGYDRDDLEVWTREQLLNELNGKVVIKSILEYPNPTPQVIHYRTKIEELNKKWREVIIDRFNRHLNILRVEELRIRSNNHNLLPYLRTLPVEQYADLLLNEIRHLTEGSETYSPNIVSLYRMLGDKVESRYHVEQKMKLGVLQKTGDIYGRYADILASCNSSDNSRQSWQRLVYYNKGLGPSLDYNIETWPIAARIGVGKFLYTILVRDLKLDSNFLRSSSKSNSDNSLPAFFKIFRHQGSKIKEELKPHPMLMKLYKGAQQENLTFDVNMVPMVCPPQPYWTTKNGGYLITHSELLRLPPNCFEQTDKLMAMPLTNIYPVLDALNQQQSVGWRINTDILDIVLNIFKKGGNSKLDIPPIPESLTPPEPPADEASLSKFDKFKYFREKLTHRKKQAEMYSLWCDAHYRLSLANHFRDRVFWLPQNLDFRGRSYSIPPHLSHLGADLGRSLLMFSQKKKLGIDGLLWLKLHCINLTGFKKRSSIRDRLIFAEEIMDEIIDSADNPIDGRRWWSKSDEPWQTLACCKDIVKAIRSGDPENYESHIPIHQDGSCNGLQHYAALGRDTLGAHSVNLAPADVLQDVYSDVANLVEQARQKDEDDGLEVAKILKNSIQRKVIKQTVMTTVYGVTKYGARLQIAKQLKDLDKFPSDWVWPASNYLAGKTFDSIREMFTSTREIQDWLVDCALLISTVCNENVEWVTPLGLPIVQPYSRTKLKNISNKFDDNVIQDGRKTPNYLKQKNAFPPNFVHSLDSCHMMLTSVHCEKIGLTFASVHDCYWTHACNVPEMNKICREQFVALHSEPILDDLSKSLIKKFSLPSHKLLMDGSEEDMKKMKLNRILTKVPKKGDFDLKNVLDSIYFFS